MNQHVLKVESLLNYKRSLLLASYKSLDGSKSLLIKVNINEKGDINSSYEVLAGASPIIKTGHIGIAVQMYNDTSPRKNEQKKQ